MKSQFITVLLLALSPSWLLRAEQRPPHWSVDLNKFGYFTGQPGTASTLSSDDAVAATDSYVAVALQNEEPATGPPKANAKPQSKLLLLIFAAGSGKLSATCGPWTINAGFELRSTASGNFLLHLTPLSETKPQRSESLVLLSPNCEQLKQILLQDQGTAKPRLWQTLQSPSRKTLVLINEQGEGSHFELLDLESLDSKSKWFEHDSMAPKIIGVSDNGFLGVPPGPKSTVIESRPIADDYNYYRTFDGPWQRLPYSNCDSFLSDDTLICTSESTPEPWKVSKTQIKAIRLDGTVTFSATVSGAGYHVWRNSDISVSSGGDHFAFTLDFAGAGWLWGTLDMGPEHHSIYVWSASRPEPSAKIKLVNWLDHPVLGFSFAPDGSWFAVLVDHSTLNIRPLESPK